MNESRLNSVAQLRAFLEGTLVYRCVIDRTKRALLTPRTI
jgi:hypothetical protein